MNEKVLRDGLRLDLENLSIMVLLDVIILKTSVYDNKFRSTEYTWGSYMKGYRLEYPQTCIWAVAGTIKPSLHKFRVGDRVRVRVRVKVRVSVRVRVRVESGWSQD